MIAIFFAVAAGLCTAGVIHGAVERYRSRLPKVVLDADQMVPIGYLTAEDIAWTREQSQVTR